MEEVSRARKRAFTTVEVAYKDTKKTKKENNNHTMNRKQIHTKKKMEKVQQKLKTENQKRERNRQNVSQKQRCIKICKEKKKHWQKGDKIKSGGDINKNVNKKEGNAQLKGGGKTAVASAGGY